MTRLGFVQTGGFAGLRMAADVDTADLAAADADALERQVDAALEERASAGEPAGGAESEAMRDDQQYEVTVTRGDETLVLRAADPWLPPALGALVASLQDRAEPSRRSPPERNDDPPDPRDRGHRSDP